MLSLTLTVAILSTAPKAAESNERQNNNYLADCQGVYVLPVDTRLINGESFKDNPISDEEATDMLVKGLRLRNVPMTTGQVKALPHVAVLQLKLRAVGTEPIAIAANLELSRWGTLAGQPRMGRWVIVYVDGQTEMSPSTQRGTAVSTAIVELLDKFGNEWRAQHSSHN